MATENKMKMYGIPLMAFAIGLLLGMYTIPQFTTAGNENGPFVVVPGNLPFPEPGTGQVCGAGGNTVQAGNYEGCCNWADSEALRCHDAGAKNCRVMDLVGSDPNCNVVY